MKRVALWFELTDVARAVLLTCLLEVAMTYAD